MGINEESSLCHSDPGEWEYDGGTPDFTGDIEKLSPHIREVQEQIVRDAFGDREQRTA